MTNEELQRELTRRGLYAYRIDHIIGARSRAGIDKALANAKIAYHGWADYRRQIAFEQLVYKEAKIEVGSIDGLVGEMTRQARRVWEDRKNGGKNNEETWRDNEASNPAPPPVLATKWPRQVECPSFYGPPGTNHARLILPCPFRIAWEPEKTITATWVHEKCHAAFEQVWNSSFEHYGYERFREIRLDMYGGCYNNRKMRGGTSLSMHAYACAWDIDPDRNQLKWGRDKAGLDDVVYNYFWGQVEAVGGVSLGRQRNYDWMHFQFARF